MGIVWSGFAVRVHDVDPHGIVRCGALVAYFSTWHRDGHVVRLALSEGSPGGSYVWDQSETRSCLSGRGSECERRQEGFTRMGIGYIDW